eukprot:3653423-Amphidinium_carterae.1
MVHARGPCPVGRFLWGRFMPALEHRTAAYTVLLRDSGLATLKETGQKAERTSFDKGREVGCLIPDEGTKFSQHECTTTLHETSSYVHGSLGQDAT